MRLRAQRRALDPALRAAFNVRIAHHLTQSSLFLTSNRIATYWASRGEADPRLAVQRAWTQHKRVYLPVLLGPLHNHLRFALFTSNSVLHNNRFGIPEPCVTHTQLQRGISMDLVLVPLVAFDNQGARLGMGGGYYDRSFAARLFRRSWCKPRLIGVAYELQRVASLEQQPWDVRLDGVVTERQLYLFNQ
ncbi:MAG: 5-formyltetrahydrofolate cyclo-ligase [Gammaproteobacteria bacterium]|nr:5-formyltetrahydrofolate cyclo-ligase [Gammaproteobacteria bacterium]